MKRRVSWHDSRTGLDWVYYVPCEATGSAPKPLRDEIHTGGRDDPFLSAEGVSHHRRLDSLSARIAELEADCNRKRKANIISDMADELARLRARPMWRPVAECESSSVSPDSPFGI